MYEAFESTICWVLQSVAKLDKMSEGEGKQVLDSVQEGKPESMVAAPTGQSVSSVSPPVSTVTQPPATAATEDEEEESEDESEILEESPCGRWQKRREEVFNEHVLEKGKGLLFVLLDFWPHKYSTCFFYTTTLNQMENY